MRRSQTVGITAVLVAFGIMPAVLAQPGQGRRQGTPVYDTKTEATLNGTIEAVETIEPAGRSGRRSVGGTHLTFKTATETLEVHLGPTGFLKEKKIAVAKGDEIELLGSRVSIDGEPVILVREIKKGTETWTLRDASGRPLWSARAK
jgi:hypothetical protein